MNKNNNARQYPIEFAHFSYMGKNNFIKAPCNGMVYFAEYHKYGKVKGFEENYKETFMDI